MGWDDAVECIDGKMKGIGGRGARSISTLLAAAIAA